ncbi:restriction endonuclease [Oceanobacillus rekensis]|uniref:restriction endonuclease n=1 Tax=Oceanobacillus rekensis TaxID=937927 RepID=UPI001592FC8E|nr:restriction endonuclease [Oceanobacillus rekensis]
MARRGRIKKSNLLLYLMLFTGFLLIAAFYQIVLLLSSLSIVGWLIIGIVITGIILIRRNLKQKRERKEKEERCKVLERQGNLNQLRKMPFRQFEIYVCDLFRQMGYDAHVTPPTGDGGKDIMIYRDDYFAIAECKRFGEGTKVTRPQIQKFHSAIIDCKAEKGYFVTTGEFTKHAISYVLDKPIILVNGSRLVEIIEEATKKLDNESEVFLL